MDMDDDRVTDPTAEFGELFEGQTVAFESELGVHADDVLGAIGQLDLGHHHHHRTHHHSDHEILSANLPFVVPDDYLQIQNPHIIIDSENTEYMVPIDVGNLDTDNQGQQHGVQQLYIHHAGQEHQQMNMEMDGTTTTISYEYAQVPPPPEVLQDQQIIQAPVVEQQGPVAKKKVKVVKSKEYFAKENMGRYFKRRGFMMKGSNVPTKSISKTVLALTMDAELSGNGHSQLVSFGSKYEPEFVSQEMERFWKFYLWTKTKNLLMSVELQPMLVPMLLHFYFQMMFANANAIARRICVEFIKKFLHEDKTQAHYDHLVAIMKVGSLDALKADKNLIALANKRYEFILSELTMIQLRRFLSKSTNPTLVNLFAERFKLRCRESKELLASIDWDTVFDSDNSDKSDENGEVDDHQGQGLRNSTNESVLGESDYVQDVIDELRNSATANLPAISVFTTGDVPICGAVSKKGTLIAYGLQECGMRICPVENARDVTKSNQIQRTEYESSYGTKSVGGHAGSVYGVHFHPRTKLLFSVGEDSFMRAWDLNTDSPRCRAVYRGHVGPIWKLDIPESGSLIATAGLDTSARIFLPERTEFVRIMAGHYLSVNAVKFHPNEAYIATGSADKSVRLWSVNDGNMVRMFTGAGGTVNALAFHCSGKYLAGAGEDDQIVIWDLAEGEPVVKLNSLRNCKDLAFSGSVLSACYRNGMLQIFNLRPILGDSTSKLAEDFEPRPSVSPPFTTRCFARTLFKVNFTDPGRLVCLGSDLTDTYPREDDDTSISIMHSNAHVYQDISSGNILHTVLQTNINTNEIRGPTGTSATGPINAVSSIGGGSIASSSKILAARLSQPLSSSGNDEDGLLEGPSSVGTTGILTPMTNDTNLLHKSPLDAAISSVIDQDGGISLSDGGTITMYASN